MNGGTEPQNGGAEERTGELGDRTIENNLVWTTEKRNWKKNEQSPQGLQGYH